MTRLFCIFVIFVTTFTYLCVILVTLFFSCLIFFTKISVLAVLPCSVKKVNKLLRNILVTSLPKTTKNDVTKMGWEAQLFVTSVMLLSWNKEKMFTETVVHGLLKNSWQYLLISYLDNAYSVSEFILTQCVQKQKFCQLYTSSKLSRP